jgi:ketosteroid isomerase-like protein
MSQADIERLRAGYKALSRGDWDEAFSAMHPDFELETPVRFGPGTYRGPEAARRFFEDLLEPFEDVTVEPLEFFERGDRIVAFIVVRYRPAGSSATMENRIGHLWTMREGRATRLQLFPRREEALEAAGLSE